MADLIGQGIWAFLLLYVAVRRINQQEVMPAWVFILLGFSIALLTTVASAMFSPLTMPVAP